jgi:hypothetical protein
MLTPVTGNVKGKGAARDSKAAKDSRYSKYP